MDHNSCHISHRTLSQYDHLHLQEPVRYLVILETVYSKPHELSLLVLSHHDDPHAWYRRP